MKQKTIEDYREKEPVHIIYFKTTRHRWYQETARRIEAWFAENYPGVSPWIK